MTRTILAAALLALAPTTAPAGLAACELHQELAEAIMANRQSGIPMRF